MTMRLLPVLGLLLVAARAEAQTVDPRWMDSDSATKRVTFALVAGLPGVNGGLNFNGFTSGGLTFVVPAGWQVTFAFGNQDHALTHSFEVIAPRAPLPIQAVTPTIPGASSKELLLGLAADQRLEMVPFRAAAPGEYLIYCGVPGHGMAGMWIRLRIDAKVGSPQLLATPTPDRH